MTVLVTGGAGYIGSHVVRLLERQGRSVVVIDDLSYGFRNRIPDTPLIELDLASNDAESELSDVISTCGVDSVIHFASRKQVPESVAQPLYYYRQNVDGLINLLSAMQTCEVSKMIFSSSASVYGNVSGGQVLESTPTTPANPYGRTKAIGEQILADCSEAWGLRFIALRYFNVAGAGWPELTDRFALNVVPMFIEKLVRNEQPHVFGDDYNTPDGTCIRDYIHVMDLADAHIQAMLALDEAGLRHTAFNIGTGLGTSVLEIAESLSSITQKNISPLFKPRRPGDPAEVVGNVERARDELNWKANFGLLDILQSAWDGWQYLHHS